MIAPSAVRAFWWTAEAEYRQILRKTGLFPNKSAAFNVNSLKAQEKRTYCTSTQLVAAFGTAHWS
jgi:hypothetical protein